jgi:hypothetical protein
MDRMDGWMDGWRSVGIGAAAAAAVAEVILGKPDRGAELKLLLLLSSFFFLLLLLSSPSSSSYLGNAILVCGGLGVGWGGGWGGQNQL